MMTRTGSDGFVQTVAHRRTIAIVGKRPDAHVLNTVIETGDYDILLIESVGQAYSQIKRTRPQIVIVCIEACDLDGVQVLSMLSHDAATKTIPVVTYFASPEKNDDGNDGASGEVDTSFVHHLLLRSMN